MSGEWAQPYPPGYREQLIEQTSRVGISREEKAAIVEELERLGQRTADENRAGIETAGVNPGTATSKKVPTATDTVPVQGGN